MAQQEQEQAQKSPPRRRENVQEDGRTPNTKAVVEKGRRISEQADTLIAEIDKALAEGAARAGLGEGEEGARRFAGEFVRGYQQQGGE